MTTADRAPFVAELRHGLSGLRASWIWFLVVGAALIALGFVALGSLIVASLATALVIGSLLLLGGIAETMAAFWVRNWSGFFFLLLSGVLLAVVGALFLQAPVGALIALTLLLSCMLMVGGIFKIIAALNYRFAVWGWPLVSGIIDLALGIMIWRAWPASALWVIGMFVGISLVFRGFNWIGLGLSVHELPRQVAA